jgi:hypothetical protein
VHYKEYTNRDITEVFGTNAQIKSMVGKSLSDLIFLFRVTLLRKENFAVYLGNKNNPSYTLLKFVIEKESIVSQFIPLCKARYTCRLQTMANIVRTSLFDACQYE